MLPGDILMDLGCRGVVFRVGPEHPRGQRKLYMADPSGVVGTKARDAVRYWHDDLVALVGETQVSGRGASWPLQVPDWLRVERGRRGSMIVSYPRLNGTIAYYLIRRNAAPLLI